MNFNTCLDLYAFLYRYEENNPNRNKIMRTVNCKQQNQTYTPVSGYVDRKTNDRRDVRCFNCFDMGHLSINCDKPQRRFLCYKCQRSGHIARDCTETDQQKAVPVQITSSKISRQRIVQRAKM